MSWWNLRTVRPCTVVIRKVTLTPTPFSLPLSLVPNTEWSISLFPFGSYCWASEIFGKLPPAGHCSLCLFMTMIFESGTMIKNNHLTFFSLYFESMYYKYLPCQNLSHDCDDFLNYEFSIRFPAITQFKIGPVQKRELGRGRMWRHPIKTSKQTWLL